MSIRLLCLAAFVSLAAACADPAAGEWELSDISFGELSGTEYYGESCTERWSTVVTLDVEDAGAGEVEGDLTVRSEWDPSSACPWADDVETNRYDFEGENKGSGDYDIEVDDFVDFECQRDGDKLECEDDEGDDWTFRR